jgi:hypothetical protein
VLEAVDRPLNEEYATMIARDWNVKHSGAGYVTRFEVRRDFLDRYEVHQVGGQTILEYWIPAEDLDALNENIVGRINVAADRECAYAPTGVKRPRVPSAGDGVCPRAAPARTPPASLPVIPRGLGVTGRRRG